ncbi:MAG: putative response regulator [Chloroflexi bacterium]|nr:putative response regulator [Chloroflexota bacterium]
MKGKILWIQGKKLDSPDFIAALRKRGYQVEAVSSGNAALLRMPEWDPNLVVVHAASLRTSGKRICQSIQKQAPKMAILVISESAHSNPNDPCANEVLVLPFTARKLIGRLDSYMPWGDDQVLLAGPIQLDLDNRRVRCQERQARLTPALTALLKLLMEHPGELLEREQLFRQVWHTEYTGDTRTLDVHISWLRYALEEDPRHPVLIKTVRGVGYRLDVE